MPYKTPLEYDLYREEANPIESSLSTTQEPKIYLIKEIEKKTITKSIFLKKKEFTKPLRLVSSRVLGNLFLRVDFLSKRIEELEKALQNRINVHQKIITEIEKDIEEKKKRILGIGDINLIRELELDITNLKMEKRKEMVNFWKDTLEIQGELQELREQYMVESRILEVFRGGKSANSE